MSLDNEVDDNDIQDVDAIKSKEIPQKKKSFFDDEINSLSDGRSFVDERPPWSYNTLLRLHWRGIFATILLAVFTIWECFCFSMLYKRVGCIFIVISFWITDVIPPEITALLPIVLFPFFDVLTMDEIAANYMNEIIFMMISAFILSAVIETCGLHKVIAVRLLLVVGFRVKVVHGILMLLVFLTASVAEVTFVASVMYPIVRAVLIILDKENVCKMYKKSIYDAEKGFYRPSGVALGYYFGVCFVATIASPSFFPITVFSEFTEHTTGNTFINSTESGSVNISKYTLYVLPLSVALTVFVVLQLQIMHLGLFRSQQKKAECGLIIYRNQDHKMNADNYRKYLEKPGFEQIIVIILALLLLLVNIIEACLGTQMEIFYNHDYGPSIHVVAVVFLLSALPRKLTFLNYLKINPDVITGKEANSILNWNIVREKVPWNIVLLNGGWNNLANAAFTDINGNEVSLALRSLRHLTPQTVLLILLTTVWILTQFCDSSALMVSFSHIVDSSLGDDDSHLRINHIYVFLPVLLVSQMAFLLPVSTSTNLLIAESAHIKTKDFMISGAPPFFLSLIMIYVQAIFLIEPVFLK